MERSNQRREMEKMGQGPKRKKTNVRAGIEKTDVDMKETEGRAQEGESEKTEGTGKEEKGIPPSPQRFKFRETTETKETSAIGVTAGREHKNSGRNIGNSKKSKRKEMVW